MRLKDSKEQVYGPAVADRSAWVALRWATVAVARGLGVFHRGRRAHLALTDTVSAQRSVAEGLDTLGGPRGRWGGLAVAICVRQGSLYGSDTQWITDRQCAQLLGLVAKAMGRTKESAGRALLAPLPGRALRSGHGQDSAHGQASGLLERGTTTPASGGAMSWRSACGAIPPSPSTGMSSTRFLPTRCPLSPARTNVGGGGPLEPLVPGSRR